MHCIALFGALCVYPYILLTSSHENSLEVMNTIFSPSQHPLATCRNMLYSIKAF